MNENTNGRGGINPISISNLVHIKPGEVRNPNGRPRGSKNRSTNIIKYLDAEIDYTDPVTKETLRITAEEMLVLTAIRKGGNGDIAAIALLLDGAYGKQKTGEVSKETEIHEYSRDYSLLPDDKLERYLELLRELVDIDKYFDTHCIPDPNRHIESVSFDETDI